MTGSGGSIVTADISRAALYESRPSPAADLDVGSIVAAAPVEAAAVFAAPGDVRRVDLWWSHLGAVAHGYFEDRTRPAPCSAAGPDAAWSVLASVLAEPTPTAGGEHRPRRVESVEELVHRLATSEADAQERALVLTVRRRDGSTSRILRLTGSGWWWGTSEDGSATLDAGHPASFWAAVLGTLRPDVPSASAVPR
jgi:hypothetical protein